jgi:hypothetical protein
MEALGGSVAPFGTTQHAITVARAGTLNLRLTWADAAGDLDLYLAPATCTQLYPKSRCGVLASSELQGGNSEQIAFRLNAAGSYAVFIDSLDSSRTHAYTLTVTGN